MSDKFRQWAPLVATTYLHAKAEGANNDVAAEACRDHHPDLVGGIALSTIQREVRRYINADNSTPADDGRIERHVSARVADAMAVPEAVPEHVQQPLILKEYRDAIVLSDAHMPRHNKVVFEHALNEAIRRNIRRLLLPGDTFDLGQLSSFTSYTNAGAARTEQEFRVCENLFEIILSVFDEVVMIGGNHDEGRWQKVLGGAVGFERLVRMILGDRAHKIRMTGLRWCLARSPIGTWRITHQAGRGRKKVLSSATELAQLEGQHVLMGHEHTMGIAQTSDARWWACNAGVACDQTVMEYKQRDTTHTRWAPGYVRMENGFPQLVPSELINRPVIAPATTFEVGGKKSEH